MNAVVINLTLAAFWLFFGVGLLVHEQMAGRLVISLPNGMNPGWLGILFAGFNLFRAWYNWNFYRRRQRQRQEEQALRGQWERHHDSERQPDPTFQFTDEPAQKIPERSTANQAEAEPSFVRPGGKKHWERTGGYVGLLIGGLAGLFWERDQLANNTMEAFGGIVFCALAGAVIGATLGLLFGLGSTLGNSSPDKPA
jgi:hypothetical protein